MPWAVWVVAVLLASVWIPLVGKPIAYAIIILTLLPIAIITSLFQHQDFIQGPIGVAGAENFHSSNGALQAYWAVLGAPTMVWLTILVLIAGWFAWRRRTQRKVRGLLNALILFISWPICFWAAMNIPVQP